MSSREARERRRVLVVAGQVHVDHSVSEDTLDRDIDDKTVRVLENLAYKADAVLSWPEGLGRARFRFIIGLGKVTVSDALKATRLATDTLDAFEGLSVDRLIPIKASIGVSRGMISTVRNTEGRLLRYVPIGDVLGVAEKLAGVGGHNDVLVAGEVYRLVGETTPLTNSLRKSTFKLKHRVALRGGSARGAVVVRSHARNKTRQFELPSIFLVATKNLKF